MKFIKAYERARSIERLNSISRPIDLTSTLQKEFLERYNQRCEELHINPPPEIKIIPFTAINAADVIGHTIYIGGQQFETLTMNELMGISGHETAHIRLGHKDRKFTPDQEQTADQFAAIFCGNPEHLASALEKNRTGLQEWDAAINDASGFQGWITRTAHAHEKRKEEQTYGKFSDRLATLRNTPPAIDR